MLAVPPATIRSFLLTAEPMVTVTPPATHADPPGGAPPAPAAGGEVPAPDAGPLPDIHERGKWEAMQSLIGMIKAVPLAAADRQRMLAALAAGEALSPADERTLYMAERKATRVHRQAKPPGADEALAAVLAQRGDKTGGGGGRGGDQGGDAMPADPWAAAAVADDAAASGGKGGKPLSKRASEWLASLRSRADAAVAGTLGKFSRGKGGKSGGARQGAAAAAGGEGVGSLDAGGGASFDAGDEEGDSVTLYLLAAMLWLGALGAAAYFCLCRRAPLVAGRRGRGGAAAGSRPELPVHAPGAAGAHRGGGGGVTGALRDMFALAAGGGAALFSKRAAHPAKVH
jgi:hypothetical protein